MKLVCLSSDLMMTGKIASLARQRLISCEIFQTFDALEAKRTTLDEQAEPSPMLWLIDLQRCATDFARIVHLSRQFEAPAKVVGYAQHVHPELLEAAEVAGFDQVLTRGKFDRQVASIIDEFVHLWT